MSFSPSWAFKLPKMSVPGHGHRIVLTCFSYALYSPDMGHSSITRDPHQGGGLSTTVYSHYGVDQQSHVQPIQPFGGSRFQGPSSPQRNGGAFHVPQAYFQQQQQSSPYRHILPAQPQHHGHHRNLRIETGTTNPTAFDNASFLSPILSVSSPMQPFEQVNSIMSNIRRLQVAGRLNERFLAVNGHYLTKFEQYIQNFVLWRSRGAPLSPEDVYEFCRICAGYVQHDADVGRVVPPNLEQTLRKALGSADRVAVIEAAVQYHQRQLQREQQDGGLVIPPWVSVWISACQQCLSGSLSVLDEHLDALRCLPNAPLDIHELRTCLPRQITPAPYGTPESSSNQLPNQNVWDQQQ